MKFELDAFNGVIIDIQSLPADTDELKLDVANLVVFLHAEHKALAWITLPITQSAAIPIFVAQGFMFHSCLADALTLVRQPENPVFVPFVPTHTLGAGAIVLNEHGELLVIKERGSSGFKLPGGHVDPGERIQDAILREVLEETGIETTFDSITGFTTQHPYRLGKSNIHFICNLKPVTQTINILDTDEIEEAKWIPLQHYLADPANSLSNRQLVSQLAYRKGLVTAELQGNTGRHRKQEVFVTDTLESNNAQLSSLPLINTH